MPVVLIGMIAIIGSTVLAARLIWEMTWLTWHQGPQMIGFSLAHSVAALLLLFPFILVLWLLFSACVVAFWKLRGNRVKSNTWAILFAAALVLAVLALPQSLCDFIFTNSLAEAPRGPNFSHKRLPQANEQ